MPDYHLSTSLDAGRPATLYFNLQPPGWEFPIEKDAEGGKPKQEHTAEQTSARKDPKGVLAVDAREYGQHPGYQYNHSSR